MKDGDYGILICNWCGARRKSMLTKLEYNCHKCGEPILDAVVGNIHKDRARELDKQLRDSKKQASLNYIMTGKR